MVLIGQTQRGHACVGGEMSAMPNTDDNCGDLWPVKDISHRNVGDTYIVPIRDGAKRAEQFLEEIPAADVVDDQLVFRQRPIFERLAGFRQSQPAVAQESPATVP